MPVHQSPAVLTTMPADDAAFAALVSHLHAGTEATGPEALEADLRAWYPRARIVLRDPLASLGGTRWYVYRDGRLVASDDCEWWRAPRIALAVLDQDGRLTGATPAAASILGADPAAVVGRRWSELLDWPSNADDGWLWEALRHEGSATTVARVRAPRGNARWVEYRLEQDAHRPGYLVHVREQPN